MNDRIAILLFLAYLTLAMILSLPTTIGVKFGIAAANILMGVAAMKLLGVTQPSRKDK